MAHHGEKLGLCLVCLLRTVERRAKLRFGFLDPRLLAQAFGDVAQVGCEEHFAVDRDGRDRQLHRDLGTVGAQCFDLDPGTQDPLCAGREEPGHPVLVGLPIALWHDRLGQGPAEDLLAAKAEGALRGGIELDDPAVGINGDDAVQRRLDHGMTERLAARLTVIRRTARASGHGGQGRIRRPALRGGSHGESKRSLLKELSTFAPANLVRTGL